MNPSLDELRTRVEAWGLDRAWPFLALAAIAVLVLALTLNAPSLPGEPEPRRIQDVGLPDDARRSTLDVQDTDGDGLANSLENYVHGTDPTDPTTADTGIPDGYLASFGYDPLNPKAPNRTVATPPPAALPAAFNDAWPERYQLTVREYYQESRPDDPEANGTGWWKSGQVPSPRNWDVNSDGIPDAWFLAAGLDPFETSLDQVVLEGNDTLTVAENWELGTNPVRSDTDGDGILDAEEPEIGTDPLAFSTLGADVADGWLRELGLDPLDPDVLYVDPDNDGLTTAEEFQASRRLRSQASISELANQGLDPFDWDTSGDGIPDGWLVAHDLDPLDRSVGERVTERASDFDPLQYIDEAPDDAEALGDLELTVRQEYGAGRPPAWNESTDGVWWGGTSPSTNDTDGDGLPDAVEIRGWYVELTLSTGPSSQAEWIHVTSNPSRRDSDGDGLTDGSEYRGQAPCPDGSTRSFPPTHPSRRSSAFSGLSDEETVCGFTIGRTHYDLGPPNEGGLDPTRADTDGDLLTDGREARYWHRRSSSLQQPYPFPSSTFGTTSEAANRFPRHAGASPSTLQDRIGPDGDWDGDGLANLLDPDSSSALAFEGAEVCPQGTDDPATTFLLDGPQIDPSLFRLTDLASEHLRSAADPANPDTDGDGLPDAWEHRNGRFLTDQGRWTIDPSDPETGGSDDAGANLDQDVTRYLAPPERERTYEHNNLQECRSGTDPNTLSSAEDGVPDGWKVFWGLRYPNLVASNDPLVGDLTDGERTRILQRAGRVSIAPGQTLTGTPPWVEEATPVRYARYTELATGSPSICETREERVTEAFSDVQLAPFERVPTDATSETPCVSTTEDETRLLLEVRGSYNATFSGLAGTGANPYLVDADRDDVPDWWEGLIRYPQPGEANKAPSPLTPDADEDNDDDGLTVAREYDAWTKARQAGTGNGGPDPAKEDSDGDGLSDASEVNAGFDPKDPRTIQRLRQEGGDADGDGIPDLDEIRGWDYQGPQNTYQTSPVDPDSDTDGLLDRLGQSGRNEAYDVLGIGHRNEDGSVNYIGEGLDRSDPTQSDTSGDGVPDGWQAYYRPHGSPGPNDDASGLESRYEAGQPRWWNTTQHGVWWWGLPPQAPFCGDLDGDGLNDGNGEDPFPASADNAYTYKDFETDDPAQARTFIQAATGETALKRAQAWGPSAGNPLPEREALLDGCPTHNAPQVSLANLTFTPPTPTIGEPITVTGRVDAPDGSPAPHATVVLSTLRPTIDRALGVAFTDDEGRFELETTFASEHEAHVPSEAIFLGTRGEPVEWTATVDDLSHGPTSKGLNNRLVVWTYNTTEASWTTSSYESSFHATTTLDLQTPKAIPPDQSPTVNATLTDASGSPLPGRTVRLSWDATSPSTTANALTDSQGQASFQLPPPDTAGPSNITLSFNGSDTLEPTQVSGTLTVHQPTRLTLETPEPSAGAGSNVRVQGHLISQGSPVPDARIEIVAGRARVNATTDIDGVFQAELAIPGTAKPGTLTVTAGFPGTPSLASARNQTQLEVLGRATIQTSQTATIPQRDGGLLSGRIVDGRGRPITGQVTLSAPQLPQLTGAAGSEGRWRIVLPPMLPRGIHDAQLTLPASREHAPAHANLTLVVQSPAQLSIEPLPKTVHPGDTIPVHGRVHDLANHSLPGAPVVLRAADQARQPITTENGTFAATLGLPLDSPLGSLRISVAFEATDRPTLTSTVQNQTIAVKAPTRLDVTTRHTPMSRPSVAGQLSSRGEPVPAQPVDVGLVDPDTGHRLSETTVRTSPGGTFNATFEGHLTDHALQATAQARFAGTSRLAEAHTTHPVNLTTPLSWNASLPSRLAHGQSHTVEGSLADAAGRPIQSGRVAARIGNTTLGQAPVTEGAFRLDLTPPSSLPPGQHRLAVTLEPSGLHIHTPLAGPVTVTTQPTIDVDIQESLSPGRPFRAQASITDDGQRPMANLTLIYWIQTPEGNTTEPTVQRTNASGQAVLAGTTPTRLSGSDAELVVLARGPRLSEDVAVASSTSVPAIANAGWPPYLLGALALSLVCAAGYVVHRRRRQVGEVQEIVDELLRGLEAGNEYEASVMYAYQQLNEHLEEHGFLDQPDLSAREYLEAVQEALPLPADDVDAFVSLFEEVRYSHRSAGPDERRKALRLLRRISATLERVQEVAP